MSTPLLYLNGAILEESEARISPFDRGFLWGDGVYEVTPCFDGKLFRLEDHIERLYRSLRYVRIDPGLTPEEMAKRTRDLLTANSNRLQAGGAYRVGHWVTRGVNEGSFAAADTESATVMMFFRPIEVASIARDQREGILLSVPSTRRTPPESIEARAKVTSKMNQILAELDADAHGAKSLMLDLDGNVSENSSANFFLVRDGVLWTPPERNILEGITRKVVFELAAQLDIPLEERNFTLYDVAQADEYFLTSSAICAMPVRRIDGFTPKLGVPGPITQRLIAAFAEQTGFRFGDA
jgi:branched-chain amino acid aminotransferase